MAALGVPLVVFLPSYFATHYGLALTLVAQIFLVARFWDIFTDPIVGMLQDKTSTRFGRRRVWLATGVPVTALGAWLVFFAPFGTDASAILTGLLVLYLGFTFCQIGHISWGAELSRNYHVRSHIQGWREFANVAGMLLVLTSPVLIDKFFPSAPPEAPIQAMGLFVIAGLPIAVWLSVTFAPERRIRNPENVAQFSLRTAVNALARNGALVRLLLIDLLLGFGPGLTGALFVYFTSSALGLGDYTNILLLLYFVVGLVCVPIWLTIAKKLNKHTTLGLAAGLSAIVTSGVALLPANQPLLSLCLLPLAGISFGASPFLLRAIMADVADIDARLSGQRRTGFMFSLLNLTGKVGLALSVAVGFPLLSLVGFDPIAGANNDLDALLGLRLVFAIPASLSYLFASVLAFGMTKRLRMEGVIL